MRHPSDDPTDGEEQWRRHAACRGMASALFFPVSAADAAPAKDVCARCLVRDECLDYALRTRQDIGVWGGTTHEERAAIRRASRTRRPA